MNTKNNLVPVPKRSQDFIAEENESRHLQRSKTSELNSINTKAISSVNLIEEPDSGSMSLDNSQDKSLYLLEQIAELKELFRSQDEMVKKLQEDEISSYKGKEMQEITEGSQSPLITDPVFENSPSATQPLVESVVASTLIGVNSKHSEKRYKVNEVEPFLRFIARSRPLNFADEVLFRSCLVLFKF